MHLYDQEISAFIMAYIVEPEARGGAQRSPRGQQEDQIQMEPVALLLAKIVIVLSLTHFISEMVASWEGVIKLVICSVMLTQTRVKIPLTD